MKARGKKSKFKAFIKWTDKGKEHIAEVWQGKWDKAHTCIADCCAIQNMVNVSNYSFALCLFFHCTCFLLLLLLDHGENHEVVLYATKN